MPACPSEPRKGFALLITITLLAFLVLLLVSLASLTRVETRVASNNQQVAQARQNALMALNIALGELQKYTGPDQRTTVRSDMDEALVPSSASAPITVSGRWLGAYGSGAEADYSMAPTAISSAVVNASGDKSSQAKLLNWLVSGNEATAFNPSSNVGAKGNITTSPPASSHQFTPDGTVAGLSSSVSGATDTITIRDKDNAAKPARLLVGPATAGDSVADYVVAPLQEISAELPGMGSSAIPVGRYAWWVGDENAKARANLPKADATQTANAFVSSQRAAVELMDALNPSAGTTLAKAAMLDATGSDHRYDPADASLGKLVSADQFPMLSASASTALSRASKYRYHDIGIWSKSVLSDTYAGGLKKDLSALLADISPASHASPRANNDFLFKPEPGSTNHLGVPTWGQLRSFAQTTASSGGLLPRVPSMSMASDPAAYPDAPVPTNVGINPVMTYAAFGFRYIAPAGDSVGKTISLAMIPVVVLWNPYTVPIRGTDDGGNAVRYEVGVRKNARDKIELQGRPKPADPGAPYAWGPGNRLLTAGMGADVPNQYYRFTIESPPGGIPAGKSLVFTLKQSGDNYAAGGNILTNGMNDNYFVILPAFNYTVTSALGDGAYYRVAVNGAARTLPSPGGVTTPQTAWGVGSDAHWGGDGGDAASHEVYFGDYNPTGANVPQSSYPWSSAYAGRRIYQHFSAMGPPLQDTPPYGTNYSKTGYAVSSGASGLLQPDAPLATELTSMGPAFRMVVRSLFSNLPNAGASIGDTSRERWILQNNVRAFIMARKANNTIISARASSTDWPYDLMSPDDIHVSSGTGVDKPLNDTVLYEFRPADMPLLGIGQMQHANLGWLVNSPSYAIGNSNSNSSNHTSGVQADVAGGKLKTLAPQRLVKQVALDATLDPGKKIIAAYDQSWLLNRALWDGYFVSTVPHAGTGKTSVPADTNTTPVPATLPNPLLERYNVSNDAELRDADIVASKLLLNGGFNINSTSEQAWRALLGGTNRLGHDATGGLGGPAWDKVVFSRFSKPTTNGTASAWLGYKQLTEEQTARLAQNIVREIRRRGPSISLADFINRRLFTSSDTLQPEDVRLKGPIQAAIDAVTTGTEAINSIDAGSPLAFLAGTGASSYKVLDAYGKVTLDPFTAGSSTPGTPAPPYGTSGAGTPQFLTQADVLSTIGSQLSARSDTFVIRTYGEALDPVSSMSATPVVMGRAWCEATVQRLPDYVDGSLPAQTDLRAAPDSPARTTNQNFGRKYKIISFRWLASGDI